VTACGVRKPNRVSDGDLVAAPLGSAHARRQVAAGFQPAVNRRSGLPMPVAKWPQVFNLR